MKKNTSFQAQCQKKTLVSIVMAVWNASPYLRQALESLRAQTHGEIEVIMVNDGSTDSSEEICRDYCEADSRFILVSQVNRGVSAARNAGLEMAVGDWIAFMDADDVMMPDAIEMLLDTALTSRAGIVIGGYSRVRKIPDEIGTIDRTPRFEVADSATAIQIGLYQKKILNNPWGVLFYKDIFKDGSPLRFNSGRYEDLDLFYRAFERVEKVCILDNVVYFYRDTPGSFINRWSEARKDVLDVTDRMVSHFRNHPKLLKAAEDRRFSAHFNILMEMLRYGVDDDETSRRCLEVIKRQRHQELTDPNVRIRNKLGALVSYLGFPAIKLLCKL